MSEDKIENADIIVDVSGARLLIKHLQKRLRAAEAENERLRKAIRNAPLEEYGRAERAGCDGAGAWDSFEEAFYEWQEEALEGK